MKKKLFSLVFAILLIVPSIFALSACGEDSNKRKVSLDNSFKQSNILDVGLVEKTQEESFNEESFNFDNTNTMYSCDEEGNIYNDLDIKVEWKTSNIHLYLRLKEGYCLVDSADGKDYTVEHSNGNIKDGGLQAIKYNGPTYYVSMMPILGYECDYVLKLNSTVAKEQKSISFSDASYNLDASFTNARFKIALNNEYYQIDNETKIFNITEFSEFLKNSFETEMTVSGKVDYNSTLKIEIYFVDGDGNVDTSKILKYQDSSYKALFEKHYKDEFNTQQTDPMFPESDLTTGEVSRKNGVYTFETIITNDSTIEVNWDVFDDTIETIENEGIWNKALSLHAYEQVKYINTTNGTISVKYGDIIYTQNENSNYYSYIEKHGENHCIYTSVDNVNWTPETITELEYTQALNLFNFSLLFKFENFRHTSFTDASTGITTAFYENIAPIENGQETYSDVKLMFENEKLVKMSFTITPQGEASAEAIIELIYEDIEADSLPTVK